VRDTFDWQMPVSVTFGAGCANRLGAALGTREALVLAFEPARAIGVADRWGPSLGKQLVDWVDVADGLSSIDRARELAARIWPQLACRSDCVVVAVGGGTILDLAKLLRCRPRDGSFEGIVAALRGHSPWPELVCAPLWLLPSTAGTGSEVTRWATVWDTETAPALKRSFDEPFGYADRAFVDPLLTLSCPDSVTRDCALDTLAHALESIWNSHANPVSDRLAVSSAQRVISALPACLHRPADVALRTELSLAALEAGLAFSQTRTALAHALSYAVTLAQGVPHGQACALWLPIVWRLAAGLDSRVDCLLGEVFAGEDGAGPLQAWLQSVGVDARPAAYGIADAPARIQAAQVSARGRNFIGSLVGLA
jgi:phosphonate metabolism-associated iron-containing alcohol dehydrogenase